MTWIEADRHHVWHPFTQMKTAIPPLPVVGASGEWLELADGRRILDGISSWWVTLHGHSHPRLVKALQDQAAILDQVIFAGFSHEPASRLAARLSALWNHQLPRVFFSDNGSTAVEVAIKLAIQARVNRGFPGRSGIIALENAYHGDTLGAMSAGDRGPFTAAFSSLLFDVYRIPSPAGVSGPATPADADACLSALNKLLESNHSQISAIIVEPVVQGAGGMRMWPPGVLKQIREIANRYAVYLIADEVMTGFGRTGTMFACEQDGVIPDLLCLSKGITGGMMPLSVTLASQAIYDAFLSDDRLKTFFHGHSYTANPMACAIANASLDLFAEEPVLERVRAIETSHLRHVGTFQQMPAVMDCRVSGSILAVELRTSASGYFASIGQDLYRQFLEDGALIRPLGSVVYLMPPFGIADTSLRRLHEILIDRLSVLRG